MLVNTLSYTLYSIKTLLTIVLQCFFWKVRLCRHTKRMQDRLLALNQQRVSSGNCVVYVMSRDQRVQDNHALLSAQATAREYQLPLLVLFSLLPTVSVRGYEQFRYMLTGLEEVATELAGYNIPFQLTYGKPEETVLTALRQLKPAAVYLDFSPLHGPRRLAKLLGRELDCPVSVVDTHNIIPAWVVSDKQEFAAHTMRRKVHRLLERYLIEPPMVQPQAVPTIHVSDAMTFETARQRLETLPRRGIDVTATPGPKAGLNHLHHFISDVLPTYAMGRNDIAHDQQSGLSPYLHFGQLSSLRVALEVFHASGTMPLLFEEARMAQAGDTPSAADGMNALFEEMIVRKELSDNFCLYAPSYTNLEVVPAWAQQTLSEHADDHREHVYDQSQLEAAQTHDAAWNAAQTELTKSGKMHGYMRMYWAKKILEWSPDAARAVATTIYLNDAYSIDGYDPNGYVGILWSIAGLHDRPWTERPVFGKIRYMNDAGLRRKFDLDAYIARWQPKQ